MLSKISHNGVYVQSRPIRWMFNKTAWDHLWDVNKDWFERCCSSVVHQVIEKPEWERREEREPKTNSQEKRTRTEKRVRGRVQCVNRLKLKSWGWLWDRVQPVQKHPPEVKIMSACWNKATHSFWEDLVGILFTPAVLVHSNLSAVAVWRDSAVDERSQWNDVTARSYTTIPSSLKGSWNSWSQESRRPDSCLGSYMMISKVRDQRGV